MVDNAIVDFVGEFERPVLKLGDGKETDLTEKSLRILKKNNLIIEVVRLASLVSDSAEIEAKETKERSLINKTMKSLRKEIEVLRERCKNLTILLVLGGVVTLVLALLVIF